MKIIEGFLLQDDLQPKVGPTTVSLFKQKEGLQFDVTILEGHIADAFRWRNATEEPPKHGDSYMVMGLGLCLCKVSTWGKSGSDYWDNELIDTTRYASDFPHYRPFIEGIDAPLTQKEST